MKQSQEEKYCLNMAGEFSVCAELQKRKIDATVTYGNKKAVDIIIIGKNKQAWSVEVKTTTSNKFVTGFFQKYYQADIEPRPNFWVLVKIEDKTKNADFYVLTHKEMGEVQKGRNKMKEWHKVIGVDNVLTEHIEEYKNKWETILNEIK